MVALSSPAVGTVTVNYAVSGGSATAGTDFTVSGASLTFQAGETVKDLPVTLLDDAVVEATKTVVLSLSGPSGATLGGITEHTLTLIDDDRPVVSLVTTDVNANEAGDAAHFSLSRSGATTSSLDVNVTVSGTAGNGVDYVTAPSLMTFPAGQAMIEVDVTPIQDAVNEGTETVGLTLQADPDYIIGSASSAQVFITDNDRSSVSITAADAVAGEASNPGEFTLVRSGNATGTLQVNLALSGTAGNGSDYQTLASTVTFGNGQTTAPVQVLPIDDGLTEGIEDVIVSVLSGAYDIGGASYASVRIDDNDQAPVIHITSPVARGQVISADNGILVAAVVSDDGLPQSLTTLWTKISGPGSVVFDNAAVADTGIRFSEPGNYVLRLSAYDGQFITNRDLTVAVGDPGANWQLRNVGNVTNPAPTVSDTAGTITLGGAGALEIAVVDPAYDSAGTGAFYARSYIGDFTATVRHGNASSTASRARSGLMVRATTNAFSAYAHVGRVPQSAYDGFLWRTTASGPKDGLSSYSGIVRWLRMVRRGNSVTVFQAADVAGVPGSWTQIGAPQTVVLPDEVLIGLFVDNNLGTGLNSVTFTNFSLAPLNRAPTVSITTPTQPALTSLMQGAVSDDGQPLPAALSTLWSQRSGPGTASFNEPAALQSLLTVSHYGAYTLRLQAGDGGAETFVDTVFTGYGNAFEVWQGQQFNGGPTHAEADASDDPDNDGVKNLAEYAFGTNPHSPSLNPVVSSFAVIGNERYLRLTITKNPAATGITYGAEITNELANSLNWSSNDLVIEIDTPEVLQMRDVLPISANPRRFMRARVQLP
jgi:hypothetical protein